jgi:hypothetical protein
VKEEARSSSFVFRILRQVPGEIHRAVQDSDDLEDRSLNPDQDDVLVVRRYPASGKEILARSPSLRVRENFLEFPPEGIEVDLKVSVDLEPGIRRLSSRE